MVVLQVMMMLPSAAAMMSMASMVMFVNFESQDIFFFRFIRDALLE